MEQLETNYFKLKKKQKQETKINVRKSLQWGLSGSVKKSKSAFFFLHYFQGLF